MTSDLVEVTSIVFDAISGESYKITSFEPARPEPTPEELRASMPIITARQLRITLVREGISMDAIQSMIDALPTGTDRDVFAIELEYATTFERLHPAIVSIGAALNLTPEEIDTLWADAANT